MQGSDERIQNYTEKLIPARVQEDFVEKKPSMLARIGDAIRDRVVIESRLRSILSGEAVSTVDFIGYLSFALKVDKLHRRWGGGSDLINAVALVVYEWKTLGYTEAVLAKIREELFSIPAPSAP